MGGDYGEQGIMSLKIQAWVWGNVYLMQMRLARAEIE